MMGCPPTSCRTFRLVVALALSMAALVLSSCAPVAPWERGDLARRCMTGGLADEGLEAAYWRKVLETRTAGSLSTTAPGGGCGCSQ